MSPDNPKGLFRSLLSQHDQAVGNEKSADAKGKTDAESEYKRRLSKFNSETLLELTQAENRLLQLSPIKTAVDLLDAAADSIGEKDTKLNRRISFKIEKLGEHFIDESGSQLLELSYDGRHFQEIYENKKVEFVELLENGQSVDKTILEAEVSWTVYQRYISIKISGINKKIKDGEIEWTMGDKKGNIRIKDFDTRSFANLLSEGVARNTYISSPPEPYSLSTN